jgi:hypothetical protein
MTKLASSRDMSRNVHDRWYALRGGEYATRTLLILSGLVGCSSHQGTTAEDDSTKASSGTSDSAGGSPNATETRSGGSSSIASAGGSTAFRVH